MTPDESAAEIVNTRRLPWPRTAVFAAFAEPQRLARWWGPRGFTNRFETFEFRPGGRWRFTMTGPDGASFAMDKVFAEIVAPERIVVAHRQAGHDFILSIALAERDGETDLSWRMRFADPAEAARLRTFLLQANEENLDRLQEHLVASMSGSSRPIR